MITDRELPLTPIRSMVTRCGWCKRFKADNGQYFPITAGGLLDYFEGGGIKVSHGVCPDCFEEQKRKLMEGLI